MISTKKWRRKKGSGLTEILVCFAIFGVLLGVCVQAYSNFDKESAKINAELDRVVAENNLLQLLQDGDLVDKTLVGQKNFSLESCLRSADFCYMTRYEPLNVAPIEGFQLTTSGYSFKWLDPELLAIKLPSGQVAYVSRFQYVLARLQLKKVSCKKHTAIVEVDLAFGMARCGEPNGGKMARDTER